MKKKGNKLIFPQLTCKQISYTFHKYIDRQRPINFRATKKYRYREWNELDEKAYQAIKIGIFEVVNEEKRC